MLEYFSLGMPVAFLIVAGGIIIRDNKKDAPVGFFGLLICTGVLSFLWFRFLLNAYKL